MGCDRYQEAISEAALATLTAAQEAKLHAHLARCAACRTALDVERQLVAAIDCGVQASMAAEPSPDFAAGVRCRLAEENQAGRPWFAAWVPALAAALAAVALLALWVGRREPARPTSDNLVSPPRVEHGTLGMPKPAASPTSEEQAASRPGLARSRQSFASTAEPEVLVPPDQQKTVLAFYRAVWSGRVDASSLVAPPGRLKPGELTIQPLEVVALDAEFKPLEPAGDR